MKAIPAIPTTESLRKQIEARAYVLWERAGRPHGRHEEHWIQAEEEILSEAKAPARKRAKATPKPSPKKSGKPKKK
jgi:lysozyme family protein